MDEFPCIRPAACTYAAEVSENSTREVTLRETGLALISRREFSGKRKVPGGVNGVCGDRIKLAQYLLAVLVLASKLREVDLERMDYPGRIGLAAAILER